jgi:thiamine transport system permease protein
MRWSLTAVLAFPFIAVIAGLAPVFYLGFATGHANFDTYIWTIIRFTLLQATLSTFISITLGTAFAHALHHQSFPGRKILIQLLALPLALPAIVVALGIVSIFGANGILGGHVSIYGLTAILLAHVFFNFPLAARLALATLDAIPAETQRLANQLGFSKWNLWRHIEWPTLKTILPGTALLIFLLCAASFTIVLTLGGGPQATTLEVAIYQALRFDFDPARASLLSILQIALCAILVFASQKFPASTNSFPALRQSQAEAESASLYKIIVIIIGTAILLPPLIAIIIDGLPALFKTDFPLRAFLTSIIIGAISALACVSLCWPIAAIKSQPLQRIASATTLSALILPPTVMATGWFILLNSFAGNTLIYILVITLNTLMALPFAYTILHPAIIRHAEAHDRLCASLSITGFNRLRLIDWPTLRRPASLACVMAMIISLGDLTAVLLFGSGNLVTLPSLIYQQMGSYRIEQAAGTALILATLAASLLAIAQRLSHD